MESSPSSESSEHSYDNDKKDGKESGKRSVPLRVPLPADALHGSEPRRESKELKTPEQVDGILPIFPKREHTPAPTAEKAGATAPAPQEAAKAEQPGGHAVTHPELAGISDKLWQEFDNTEAVVADTEADRRAAATAEALERAYAMPAAELPANHPEADTDEDDDDEKAENDDDDDDVPAPYVVRPIRRKPAPEAPPPAAQEHEQRAPEIPAAEVPEPDEWHESRTLHLNEPEPVSETEVFESRPAAEIPPTAEFTPLPTAAAMAAEVAATEPDRTSFDPLERAYAMPAAELPANHPEAAGEPLPPMTSREQFQDMMQRAEFNPDFIQQASGQAHEAPMAPHVIRLENQSEPEPPAPYTPSSAPSRMGSAPLPGTPDMRYAFPGTNPNQYYAAGMAAEGALLGGMAGAAAGAAVTHSRAPRERQPDVPQQPAYRQPEQTASFPNTPIAEQRQSYAAPYAQERPAPQPYRQPEQPAPITNEQRTALQYPEQFRPSAAVRAETQPPQAAAVAPERIAAVPLPPAEAAAQEQLPAEPKTHTVESAWHRVQVENGTNRIVEGQPEGRALVEEKRAESAPVTTSDQTAQNPARQDDQAAASMYQQILPGGIAPMIASGQIGAERELGSGQVDDYHRLEAPHNPVVTALTSPLLWVGVIVLLIAFFASAFL